MTATRTLFALALLASALLLGACDEDDSDTKTQEMSVTEELQGVWSSDCIPDGPDGRLLSWEFVESTAGFYQTEHFADLACESEADNTFFLFQAAFQPTGETKTVDEGEVEKVDFYPLASDDDETVKQVVLIDEDTLRFGVIDGGATFDEDGYPEDLDTDETYTKGSED